MQIQTTVQDMRHRQDYVQEDQSYGNFHIQQLECRICLEAQIFGNVLSPCNCRSHVHPACLQQWINRTKSRKCEVCLQSYDIKWKKTVYFSLKKFSETYESQGCETLRKIICLVIFGLLFIFLILSYAFDIWKFGNKGTNVGIQIIFFTLIGVCFGIFLWLLAKLIIDSCLVSKLQIQA